MHDAFPLSHHAHSRPGLLPALRASIRLIVLAQGLRAAATLALWAWLRPAPLDPRWSFLGIAAFLLAGAALGLRWSGPPGWMRQCAAAGLLLWPALALASLVFGPAILLENIHNALVLPIFEELVFRGWIWARLEQALGRGWRPWLLTSALFALWHLGYMDIYLLKALPASPGLDLGFFLWMKLATTFIIGLVVGLPRWISGRVYGSAVLHGLVNIFGR